MLVYEYPELDALRGFLSSVPSISFGGCGFAAIAIYDNLLKNGHKDVEIIFAYSERSEWKYNQNIRVLTDGFDELESCTHVLIHIGEHYIDCNEDRVLDEYAFSHPISRETMIEVLQEDEKWNHEFIRHIMVPLIEKRIGYRFW